MSPSPDVVVGSRTGGVGSSATSAATSASIAVSTVSAAPASAAGVVTPGPASASPPPPAAAPSPSAPTSIVNSGEPAETVSQVSTLSSLMTPPNGAGTSMVALSDSRVTSGSSSATVSPG